MIKPQGTLYIGTKWYEVDVNKLRKSSMTDAAYLFASLRVNEDYEHFDRVKHLLIIPEPRKSIEELQQELDEKIEKLIENFKEKSKHSKQYAEYRYNQFCEKQDGDFEYAKTQGYFPKLTIGTIDYSTLSVSGGYDIGSPSFVVKQGNSHQGYYTIGDGYYKFYMSEKPNMIFRWFVYKLMGFKWVDEKNV